MNKIRLATLSDAELLSRLVDSLSSYISDKPLSEAFKKSFSVEAFNKCISNDDWFTILVYEEENEVVAYISIVNNTHLYHFFVKESSHKKGIGRKLWQCVLEECSSKTFTVNASLSSVLFYEKLGFKCSEEEQQSMGVKYQPMSFGL